MATPKQHKAVEIAIENYRRGNPKTQGEILIEAGYSKATSIQPTAVTESKGFKELMELYLPDDLLAEKHRELLTIPKKVRHFKKGDLESEYEELDSAAISKGLDMAYKLKGAYAPDKSITVNVDANLTLTDEDKKLIEIIRQHERYTDTTTTEPIDEPTYTKGDTEATPDEIERVLSDGVDTPEQN